MIYMTRALFSLLFLASCSFIEVKDLPSLVKEITFGAPDIIVDRKYYDAMPYSFIKVSYGKRYIGIYTLSDTDNGLYKWVGADNSRLYTKNGKVLQSIGLIKNLKIINKWDYDFTLSYFKSDKLIMLENPTAMIEMSSTIKYIGEEEIFHISNKMSKYFEEDFQSTVISWGGKNKYWISEYGEVLRSVQSIHPHLEELEITFFYK